MITGDSLGPLAVRETEADLRKRCPRVLHIWVLNGEGEPALALKLGDARIIARMTDTTASGTVRLIGISDPAPQTAEGFGVGTRVSDLLAVHRDMGMISGQSSCVLIFSRSLRGLTFVLRPEDCRTHAMPGKRPLDQLLRPQAKIAEIWIKGSH